MILDLPPFLHPSCEIQNPEAQPCLICSARYKPVMSKITKIFSPSHNCNCDRLTLLQTALYSLARLGYLGWRNS